MANTNVPDVETLDHVVPAPTCTGEERVITLFCPSWPKLLSPQTHNVPSVLIAAQLNSAPFPLGILDHVVNAPTWVGDERLITLF